MSVTRAEPEAGRLDGLRELAGSDLDAARRATWDWLGSLDARHDASLLGEAFRTGHSPGQGPTGTCEGRVLGLMGTRFLGFVDKLVRIGDALGGIGWTGKTFNPAGTGYNRLTVTSRIPMFLAMPRYRFQRERGELTGFRFDHAVESSERDPEITVRAIKYDNPDHANPLMLPRTRDELVELVPGVYLGRALLLEGPTADWEVVAYFALRQLSRV